MYICLRYMILIFVYTCLSRGVDSHPPGGLLKFLRKTTPRTEQHVCNGSSSQPIDVGDDCNVGDCVRTEKRLPWTKEEDLRLVSYFLGG